MLTEDECLKRALATIAQTRAEAEAEFAQERIRIRAESAAQEREAVLQLIWQWLDQPGPSAEQALRKLHAKLKQGVHRLEWGGPVEGLLESPMARPLRARGEAPKVKWASSEMDHFFADEAPEQSCGGTHCWWGAEGERVHSTKSYASCSEAPKCHCGDMPAGHECLDCGRLARCSHAADCSAEPKPDARELALKALLEAEDYILKDMPCSGLEQVRAARAALEAK